MNHSISLSLTGIEAACLYSAITNELYCLQQDLQDNRIPFFEKQQLLKSVDICNSILEKLKNADPNTFYRERE